MTAFEDEFPHFSAEVVQQKTVAGHTSYKHLNPDLERSPFEMSLRAHSILDLPAGSLSKLPIYDVDPGLRVPAHFELTTKPAVNDGNSIMTWRWFQASGHWGKASILLQIF